MAGTSSNHTWCWWWYIKSLACLAKYQPHQYSAEYGKTKFTQQNQTLLLAKSESWTALDISRSSEWRASND